MVIKDALQKAIKTLKECNIDNAIFEAHLIFKTVTKLPELDLILRGNQILDTETEAEINAILERRKLGEPLQYILGNEEFMGLEFIVDKSVLIPRQDTEILIETVLEHFKGKAFTALDLCTGSGCIAISLAHFNKNARITALDISEAAVELARKNSKKLGVSDRVSFEVGDVFNKEWFGKFDLVISNPPYIESAVIPTLSKQVFCFEPKTALDGGSDGLDFYRHITAIAPKYLNRNGALAYEIGYNQKEAVTALMQNDFKDIQTIKDYGDNYRVVIGYKK